MKNQNIEGRSTWLAIFLAFGATTVFAVIPLLTLAERKSISAWQASQFWIDYSDGFVRRGLPGAVMTWLGGPHIVGVILTSLALMLLGIVSWIVLTIALLSSRPKNSTTFLSAAVVLASPFSLSLLVRDIGRYDVIAIIAFAVVVLITEKFRSDTANALLLAAVTVITTACEEFLLAFLLPIILIALWSSNRLRFSVALGVCLPGAIVGLVSVARQPEREWLIGRANAASIGGAGTDRFGQNAIGALSQTTSRSLEHLATTSTITILAGLVLFGGCFTLSTLTLWWLTGRPSCRLFLTFMTYYSAVAVGLSLVGIDYRRWWALAFGSMIVVLIYLLRKASQHSSILKQPNWLTGLALFVLIFGTAGQAFPIYPTWDPGAAVDVRLVATDS